MEREERLGHFPATEGAFERESARSAVGEVTLVGVSVRAAAFSAWRAGWRVRAMDRFGDADLRRCAVFTPLARDDPDAVVEFVRARPDAPCIYTGGLENRPDLVDRLAAQAPLWGNPGAVLRRVRDPALLAETLARAGFSYPESSRSAPRPHGAWLVKPLAGGGGVRIRWASPEDARNPPADVFYQRFVEGTSHSAVYVGAGASSTLLGVTRQLVGMRWLHAAPFGWCGNIGPVKLSARLRGALERLGQLLVQRFSLQGFFGVDFLIAPGAPGSLHVIEVNPRYTASVEVLELASGRASFSLHAAAFGHRVQRTETPEPLRGMETPATLIGKAVLFAPRSLVVSGDLRRLVADSPFEIPAAADVPLAGTRIPAARPVLTLYARGGTDRDCVRSLRKAAARFQKRWLTAPARKAFQAPRSRE